MSLSVHLIKVGVNMGDHGDPGEYVRDQRGES